MAWLQKRPIIGDSVQFFTTGMNKTKLIVGLGNPGKEYDGTRHNIGFECVDDFVSRTDGMEGWVAKKDLKCLLSTGRVGDTRILVAKPTTFMNLSGEAVLAIMNFYKISLEQIVVVHDELDVEFGQIRLRTGGSSAGHNGLKSVISLCGEGFGRIRIGIGPKKPAKMDSADFVLQAFSKDQQDQMVNLKREVGAALSEYAYGQALPQETRSFLI